MEILELFEKVKNISEIFNTQENGENKENDNILNLVNTIQTLKDLNENDKNKENIKKENNNFDINPIMKIISYLEFEHQKEVLFFLKFMEVKKIINSYKSVITTASLTEKEDAKKNILLTIKPKLNEEKQPIIDIFLKFLEINQILNKIKFKESYNEL